jgi:hypothetical protein
MAKQPRPLTGRFRSYLKAIFKRPRWRPAPSFRPLLEGLETRLTPATFSQSGNVLTIALDQANESLTLSVGGSGITVTDSGTPMSDGTVSAGNVTFGAQTATITPAGEAAYTGGINITDNGSVSGGRVTFASSGAKSYINPLSVNLASAAAGNVTFSGSNLFSNVPLTASTVGGMVL